MEIQKIFPVTGKAT